jgi:preprotein translocase subunit SecD
MSSDYIPRLRQELLRAGAREQTRWRRAAARGVRPLAAAAAVALVALAVVLVFPAGHGNERAVEQASDTIRLSYRAAGPTTEQTAQVVRDRLSADGVQDARVSVSPTGDLAIVAPAGARADVAALVRSGRFAIYDWERSVLGPRGAPAPRDANVTGGQDAGHGAAITKAAADARGRPVRALGSAPNGWFALGGAPALTNADIARPRAAVDPMTHEPIVTLDFTARGQTAFATLTRSLAHRGSAAAPTGDRALESLQHLAIVIDDRIVSVPFIDFRQAPDGIDGSAGAQISGGLTPETARRLAALLSAGPLAANLVPAG